jgi:S1-C subfamily serine protease
VAALPGADRAPVRRRAVPPPWLALLLVPLVAMLLLVSREGRALLDRLTARPEAVATLPGLTLDPTPHRAAPGLVITSIRSESQAARRGIVVGDTVVAIDRTPVGTLDQVRRYLQRDKADSVDLRVMHDDRSRDVRLGREGD